MKPMLANRGGDTWPLEFNLGHLKNCYWDERDVLLDRLLFLNSPSLIYPGQVSILSQVIAYLNALSTRQTWVLPPMK